ncbi:MAG: hypothetical protein K6U75_10305 [Firmicutes bacterium]|nr:hypothetical protein [Bacillota bacterium]
MKLDRLREEVEFGLGNLNKIHERIKEFARASVELSILQSALTYECIGYYNALEHLIVRVLKGLGKPIPSGPSSHKDTLRLFGEILTKVGMLDTQSAVEFIEELMAFRHVTTKIYGFLIDWGKLKSVVDQIQQRHGLLETLFDELMQRLERNKEE